jgi:phenylacetaldehyde dehydrogenase
MPVLDDVRLSEGARRFLGRVGPLLIDGQWVPAASGATFTTTDPATGKVLAEISQGDGRDIDLAVAAARRALEDGPWARMSLSTRARLIWRIGELIEEHTDELAELETLDNGKPLRAARTDDVPYSADVMRYMAGLATKVEGRTISPVRPEQGRFLSYVLREPVGVVGQITPWNYPLLMAVEKIAPALAAGNTVVLKPAEQTPLTALRLGELIMEAGIPAGVVNIVSGFGDSAGAALAAHEGVDKVAFTGSTDVGKMIVRAASGNLKKVTLELGGKSPNIIFGDADLERAIPGAASGIFWNHGQSCTAGSRLFAQREVYDQVVDGMVAAAGALKLGHGLEADTDMGPLVSDEQLARVSGYVESSRNEGATVACGGDRFGTRGAFMEPTVVVDTHPGMTVEREEIFGPVVTVVPFDDMDDVLRAANDTSFGLAAGVWTRDIGKAHQAASALKAGMLWINTYNVFDSALPFGGYKQSGWGRENGQAVLDLYTQTKTVTVEL